eukprot:SAG31_NODE_44217_length_263_cov_1.567073_1_plen_45_part_01
MVDAIAVFLAGLSFLNMAFTAFPWWHTLKSASILVAYAVLELKQS